MRFVDLPDSNLVLTPPADWDVEKRGPCEIITARREHDGFVVAFSLEPHELELILDGGKIMIKILGDRFPPIAPWIE
jgi:hypothetical protein